LQRLIFSFSLSFLFFSNCFAEENLFFRDDSISIDNNITDTTWLVIKSISVIGNKKTRTEIILRELTLQEGDSIPESRMPAEVQRSKENLLNTSLFNFVEIFYKSDVKEIAVIVSERWYIWPVPIFELVDRNLNEWLLKKDFSRINYGFSLVMYNFRGRNETLSLAFRNGYTRKYSLQYNIPYINKSKQQGVTFQFSYATNHEIAYNTFQNKLQYFRNDDENVLEEYYAGVQLNFRKALYSTSSFKIEYDRIRVSDSIPVLNPEYFNSGSAKQQYVGLAYFFREDHRDLVAYPLHGTYFDFEAVKRGLGFYGDDVNQLYLSSSFHWYGELSKNIFFATGVKGKISGRANQPYDVARALGYGREYVRGYEYYVVNGQNFFLLKNNLKFRLLPPFVKKFNFIPSEKFSTIPFAFYLNLFYDVGYVRDRQFSKYNSLTNTWLPGYGVGIDFSSYYDIIIRVEYSINKFAEDGIFFHFTLSI
jgi:outer membrane protein assembly factor BamA